MQDEQQQSGQGAEDVEAHRLNLDTADKHIAGEERKDLRNELDDEDVEAHRLNMGVADKHIAEAEKHIA